MSESLSPAVQDLLAALHRGRNEEWYQWIINGKQPYEEHEYQALLKRKAQRRENINRAKVKKMAQANMEGK